MVGTRKTAGLLAAALGLAMVCLCATGGAQVYRDEDLAHDPNLPREEQIRRHKMRVQQLLAKYREQHAEQQKEKQVQQQQTQQELRGNLQAMRNRKIAEARARQSSGSRSTTGRPVSGQRSVSVSVTQTGAAGNAKEPYRVSKAIVFLDPFENLTRVGDEFETDVQVFNSSEQPFDTVELHLQYDPLVVAPVSVNDSEIYKRLDGPPELHVNPSTGELAYSAHLSQGLVATTKTLLTICWQALNPILYSEIRFDTARTRIAQGERNLLGYRVAGEHIGGTLVSSLVVVPKHDSPRKLMPLFSEVALEGIDEPVHLRLEAESLAAAEGDEWVVSLVLRNDAMLPFNNVQIRLFFDPAKLQVIDWHKGNWVRQGVNIHDGFAHDRFPFEVHRANRADNEAGEIVYHMSTREARLFPGGELARIKFQALADASLADVWFDFENPTLTRAQVFTNVDYLGSSVLFLPRRAETQTADRPEPEPLRPPDT